jgi:type IV secretory pathway VirB3-like protein
MFDSLVQWFNTIPLGGPARAFAIIGIMLAFAVLLFGFWELVFVIAKKLRPAAR